MKQREHLDKLQSQSCFVSSKLYALAHLFENYKCQSTPPDMDRVWAGIGLLLEDFSKQVAEVEDGLDSSLLAKLNVEEIRGRASES